MLFISMNMPTAMRIRPAITDFFSIRAPAIIISAMTAVQNNTITAVRIYLTGLGTFGFLLADEVSSAISSKTNSKIISIVTFLSEVDKPI